MSNFREMKNALVDMNATLEKIRDAADNATHSHYLTFLDESGWPSVSEYERLGRAYLRWRLAGSQTGGHYEKELTEYYDAALEIYRAEFNGAPEHLAPSGNTYRIMQGDLFMWYDGTEFGEMNKWIHPGEIRIADVAFVAKLLENH